MRTLVTFFLTIVITFSVAALSTFYLTIKLFGHQNPPQPPQSKLEASYICTTKASTGLTLNKDSSFTVGAPSYSFDATPSFEVRRVVDADKGQAHIAQPGESWIAVDAVNPKKELASGIIDLLGHDLIMFGGAATRYDLNLQSLTFTRLDMGLMIEGCCGILIFNKNNPNMSAGTCSVSTEGSTILRPTTD